MGVFSPLGVYSCEKTDSLLNSNNQKPDSFSKLTYQRGKGTSVSKPIVLGKKYDNPYAVKNITAAWNALYPTQRLDQLPANHLQIKFKPTSKEELASIDNLGIEVFNFPFGYELLGEGTYAESQLVNGFPLLWAIVPADATFPKCPFEVEEELFIIDLKTNLCKKAFQLTNVPYKYESTEWPLESASSPNELSSTRNQLKYCNPCNFGPYVTHTPVTFTCELFPGENEDIPAGKITLEDTQLGMLPLAPVKVVYRGMFLYEEQYTDGCGNYSFKTDFWPVCYGQVNFENGQTDVRNMSNTSHASSMANLIYNTFSTYNDPLGTIWLNGSNRVNNTSIEYWKPLSMATKDGAYFTSATSLLAHQDFNAYCFRNAIRTTKRQIRLLTYESSRASSAPMLNHLGAYQVAPIINSYVSSINGPIFNWPSPFYVVLGSLAGGGVTAADILNLLPDVIIGYQGTNLWRSDNFRNLIYHELAHTAHYAVTSPSVWVDEIAYTIQNGGYGPANGSRGRRISELIESWAYFLEDKICHDLYGNKHSQPTFGSTSSFDITKYNYLHRSENKMTDENGEGFQCGLYQDLIDTGNEYITNVENPAITLDNVSGYTLAELQNALANGTVSWPDFISKLPAKQVADRNLLLTTRNGGYGLQ